MKALDKKLIRDLWRMRGQSLAIALVIASGVATFILLVSTMDSLKLMRDTFYREYGFADVFARLKRAPEGLRERIEEIPGIELVETRVVADVRLEVSGFGEPVTAMLISLPSDAPARLNRLHLRQGRLPDPVKDDESVLSEAFAEAHGLKIGDTVNAIIEGRMKGLKITGIALSPEFILQVRPGALSPDYKRYAIVWMTRDAVEAAYDMDGAFNDVVASLSSGADPSQVITRLDEMLARYGGLGATTREDQVSHRYLTEEFNQLERSATIFPAIFIGVAAFLLNVVISRTVSTQREQIAALKAFGYGNFAIGLHYVQLILLIVLAGTAGGLALGAWLGTRLSGLYMEFYRFPYLLYDLRPGVVIMASAITGAAALAGTIFAVYRAAALPPAEALRPEPPARYRQTLLDRLGFGRVLSQPSRMIIRNIERRPIKSLLSIIGISLAGAILIAGIFFGDAVDYLIDVQFRLAQREDMRVTFTGPVSWKALYDLEGVEGVYRAEPARSVPARLRFKHRSYRTAVQGVSPESRLQDLLDIELNPIEVPPQGLVLTDYLGSVLGAGPGDVVTVEVLEGAKPVVEVPVAMLVKQYIGVSAYMDIDELNRLAGEGNAVTGANLVIDRGRLPEIYGELSSMPKVAGTSVRTDEIRNFYETQAEFLLFFTFIATLLAATIAFGVIYNTARIALSERSRELASLRVLGYTRGEISYILLGELAVLTLASVPLGFLFGSGIAAYLVTELGSDLFRLPLVIDLSTYSMSAAVVLGSAAVSGLIVRRRLDRLDLVEVLKARE
ncbi:MAG: ABC transporter permease [Deltaproteobacteria bacterium]|nr:ABC transporter permease [Deltaproteobacteria bacterium]MBZ0219958.1 ABC transporter permease [Deltaproteobacteria bacterium]